MSIENNQLQVVPSKLKRMDSDRQDDDGELLGPGKKRKIALQTESSTLQTLLPTGERLAEKAKNSPVTLDGVDLLVDTSSPCAESKSTLENRKGKLKRSDLEQDEDEELLTTVKKRKEDSAIVLKSKSKKTKVLERDRYEKIAEIFSLLAKTQKLKSSNKKRADLVEGFLKTALMTKQTSLSAAAAEINLSIINTDRQTLEIVASLLTKEDILKYDQDLDNNILEQIESGDFVDLTSDSSQPCYDIVNDLSDEEDTLSLIKKGSNLVVRWYDIQAQEFREKIISDPAKIEKIQQASKNKPKRLGERSKWIAKILRYCFDTSLDKDRELIYRLWNAIRQWQKTFKIDSSFDRSKIQEQLTTIGGKELADSIVESLLKPELAVSSSSSSSSSKEAQSSSSQPAMSVSIGDKAKDEKQNLSGSSLASVSGLPSGNLSSSVTLPAAPSFFGSSSNGAAPLVTAPVLAPAATLSIARPASEVKKIGLFPAPQIGLSLRNLEIHVPTSVSVQDGGWICARHYLFLYKMEWPAMSALEKIKINLELELPEITHIHPPKKRANDGNWYFVLTEIQMAFLIAKGNRRAPGPSLPAPAAGTPGFFSAKPPVPVATFTPSASTSVAPSASPNLGSTPGSKV